jgi:LPPG:FO 2-phospho-L-lactate transferase
VLAAIAAAEVVVICPSNPIVSVGPILAMPAMRRAVTGSAAPVVAVSPIIGGRAVKGPADKMLATLGHEVSALGVARIYHGVIDGFVIDAADESLAGAIAALGIRVLVTRTLMGNVADRERLAAEVLAFARTLAPTGVAT